MNWQQEMGLLCVQRTTINYIVTAYFVAYGFAGLVLFPLPDKWGCKNTMAIFGTMHVIAQFSVILIPNYTVRLIMFAIMGAC